MTTRRSVMEEVNLIAKIADLQETDYQNTLILHAMIELLIQKGLITKDELVTQARSIDEQLTRQTQPFDLYTIAQKELPRAESRHPAPGLKDHQACSTIESPIS